MWLEEKVENSTYKIFRKGTAADHRHHHTGRHCRIPFRNPLPQHNTSQHIVTPFTAVNGCPNSIRKFRMGMCSHQPGDPPATYIYKVKIKNYCTQLILMSMACLPLVYIVPRVVFKARFHTVTRVEVLTKPIDLSKGVNNLNLNGTSGSIVFDPLPQYF